MAKMGADIELTVGAQANSLTNSIKREIDKASKLKVTLQIKADVNYLKESIKNIKATPKISVEVNKNTFSSSVKSAIEYSNGHIKTKLKVNIDENYLRRQFDQALKGAGKSNIGSSSVDGSGTKALDDEVERLRLIEQHTRLVTKGYSELNKVRNALKNIPEGSFEANGLNENHTALVRLVEDFDQGRISAEQYRESLASITGQNAGFIDSAREADKYANSFSDKLQRFKMHLTTVSSLVRAFRMVATAIRPVVNAVTEVDTALTQLRIVTGENERVIESYSNKVLKIADSTAGSVKDLINSTTTFARLGYDLDSASDLAKYTQMLENVGDIDEASATAAMTAIIKAFNVKAEDLELVMDKLVDVGNHFPISVKELAEGMNNAGSMLAVATEGDFDKSLALLTAANTTIQNISKSSTGLRTIAARVRNVGTELDDLGETMTEVEYDEIVRALTDNGVSLTNQSGELRELYDILSDLSEKWVDMSANEQAALAKTLSGTRQQNVFISLMQNFKEASDAMTKMQASEGTLKRSNDIYLESVQAHIQQLKNAFVEFSQSAIAAKTIKDFANVAKWILGAVSAILKLINALGGLKTVMPLVISFFAIFKGQTIIASLTKMWASIKLFVSNTRQHFNAAKTVVQNFGKSMTATAETTVTAAEMINTAMGVIGLAVAAANMLISVIQNAIDASNQKIQNQIDSGIKAGEAIESIEEAYAAYESTSSSGTATTEELSAAINELASSLGMSRSSFDEATSGADSYSEAIRNVVIEQEKLKLISEKTAVEAAKLKLDKGFLDPMEKTMNQVAFDLGIVSEWDPMSLYTRATEIDRNSFFRNVLGVDPDEIKESADWMDYIDQIGQKVIELKESASYGENSKEYKAASTFYNNLQYNFKELIPLMKNYADHSAQIALHEMGSKQIKNAKAFDEYRNSLIEATRATGDFQFGEEQAAAAVDTLLSQMDGFSQFYDHAIRAAVGTGEFSKGLQGIQDVAEGTTAAITELDSVLSGADYDTGLEKRVGYYDKLLEEIAEENWGGKHYKALADYFGIDVNKSVDDQIAAIERLRRYFDDVDSGMYNFLTDISEKVPEAIASFNPETMTLKWDSSKLEEFANYMGITRDALIDLLDAYIQHVPPSEWMALPADEAAAWLDQDNVIKAVSDSLVVNRERFDELANAAGQDSAELLDAIMQLDEYSGKQLLELNIDTSSIDSVIQGINLFTRSTDDAEVKIAGIASILSGLPSEQVIQVLAELNLPENIESQVVNLLPEEIQTQVTANTGEADSAIDITQQKLENLGVEILEIDGSTITITVTDNGDIDTIMSKLNVLSAYASASGVSIRTRVNKGPGNGQLFATGTKHAPQGPALLGDEYSASGKPKPELVISKGRAYLAGVSGPVVRNLSAGDVVYTYEETKKILGNNLSNLGSIPAFAQGTATRWWNKISGSAGSYSSSNSYSNYYGTSSGSGSSGSSASTSGSGDNWFEQQYELHNHYRKLDQETDQAYLTWLVGAWKQAYAQGIIELKDAHKYEEEAYKLMKDIAADAFKEEYQYHQHMLNMDQESDQEYYSWLEWRHQVAYTNNEITLDEYYKYQEEVYKKSKELIKDYFNDVDHKISMLENANKSDLEIIKWDEKGMEYAEERIADLMKEGKDNNDANVQEQQKTWWSYYKDRAKREEDTTKNAKSAAKELIDYRIKMLKQELSKEKDVLNDRLSAIKDFYSKQKELLQDQADEDKYLDEQAEKRKKVSDLEIQLAQIEYDNSAWAQKKRLELSQQLVDAQKELNEFEKEHALQVAKEKLDAIQELQEKELQGQIDAIEKTTQSEAELYQKALHDVQNGGQNLYDAMVEYNNQNGTGNPEDIAEMWDDAYTSLKKYREMFGDYYKDIKLTYGNDVSPAIVDTSKIDAGINPVKPDLKPKEQPAPTPTPAPTPQPKPQPQPQPQPKADPVQGQKVRLKSGGKLATNSYNSPTLTPASWVIGRDLYIQAAYPGRNAPYHIGTTANINDGASTWVGWVDKWQLEGYAAGTRNALAGIHRINEKGDEALFKTADGGTYRLFSGGEHVFNANATDFLHNFADNPVGILAQLLSSIGSGIGPEIKNNNMSQNISLGDIYIQGNATEKTVSEIRREKRAEIDYVLKEFNKLNRW